jgi:hypothetical protein
VLFCLFVGSHAAELVIRSTGAGLSITVPVTLSGVPNASVAAPVTLLRSPGPSVCVLQARASRRPTQLSCSMKHQPFNYSLNVLARGQAKPGDVMLVNGKRHHGATKLPLACFGPTTPTRAGRLYDASVDPTEARNALFTPQPILPRNATGPRLISG